MSAPPVPPRPNDIYNFESSRQNSLPPPVPPLPPDLRQVSLPHYADPLAAPRPQKLDPAIPANMARDLDDQANSYKTINYTPGFTLPTHSPAPPPWQPTWNQSYSPPVTYSSPAPYSQSSYSRTPLDLSPAMNSMSLNSPPLARAYPPSPPKSSSAIPALTAPIPTIASLSASLPSVQHDPAQKVSWCRDVLFLINRHQQPDSSTDPPIGPARISDPQLLRLSQTAVPMIMQIAATQPLPAPMPPHVAEAIFHRGTFAASGAYPDHVRHSPRVAFKDFEAARAGYPPAWFRLGRDYENFNDNARARNCFERGVKLGVESCAYRMGMAHLMGQLGLPANQELAMPLLHRAATLATVDVPQPAYVFGLLLLGEFSHVIIPPHLFAPVLAPGSTPPQEARRHLERAAFLNFAPAQYKLGHSYEFAQAPFGFDPLLSVQYYSLASQQGEAEADMALSKWFLCGAEGAFDKDEGLAGTFAAKAAGKGLPSAEFAMGYYAEVGVGGPKDIEVARRWYQTAAEHGNTDASDRLAALSQPTPQSLSRKEHDSITESKLVRTRTQAKQRSDLKGAVPVRSDGRIIEVIRKNSLAPSAYQQPPLPHQQPPPLPVQQQQQQQQQQTQPPGGKTGQRYTLSDLGGAPGRAPSPAQKHTGRNQSPAPRPAQGRMPSHGSIVPPQDEPFLPPGRDKKPGPTTFAEMGIQGGKAEDEKCIVM